MAFAPSKFNLACLSLITFFLGNTVTFAVPSKDVEKTQSQSGSAASSSLPTGIPDIEPREVDILPAEQGSLEAESAIAEKITKAMASNPQLNVKFGDVTSESLDPNAPVSVSRFQVLNRLNFKEKLRTIFRRENIDTSPSNVIYVILRTAVNATCIAMSVTKFHPDAATWKIWTIGGKGGAAMGTLMLFNPGFIQYVNAPGWAYRYFKNSKSEFMRKLRESGSEYDQKFKDLLAKEIDGIIKITVVFELSLTAMIKASQFVLGIKDDPSKSWIANLAIGASNVLVSTLLASLFQNPLEKAFASDRDFAVQKNPKREKFIRFVSNSLIFAVSVSTTLLWAKAMEGSTAAWASLGTMGAAGAVYSVIRVKQRLDDELGRPCRSALANLGAVVRSFLPKTSGELAD